MIPTIRIKSEPSDDNPLGFVIINESDFDASVHELFDAAPEPAGLTAKQLKAALVEKGLEFPSNASKADLQALLDAAQ
jgi:hypothetical protein